MDETEKARVMAVRAEITGKYLSQRRAASIEVCEPENGFYRVLWESKT